MTSAPETPRSQDCARVMFALHTGPKTVDQVIGEMFRRYHVPDAVRLVNTVLVFLRYHNLVHQDPVGRYFLDPGLHAQVRGTALAQARQQVAKQEPTV